MARRDREERTDQRLSEYNLHMKHHIGWRLLMRGLQEKAKRWLYQEFREYGRNNGGMFTRGQYLLFIRQVIYELAVRLTIDVENELEELGCKVDPMFPDEEEKAEQQPKQ